jgi:peptide/nickel transport system permease protein
VLLVVIRRLASLVILLISMSFVTFVLTNLLPSDPARVAAGPNAGPTEIEITRKRLGLDRPLPEQYARYVLALVRGDLGQSVRTRQPVRDELLEAAPATIELTLISTIVFVAISIPLGVITAARRQRWIDSASRIIAVGGAAVAPFWLALLLQLLFFRMLGWLPATGRLPITATPPPTVTGMLIIDSLFAGSVATFLEAIRHLVLPVTALALGRIAVTTRLTRAQMLTELGTDYVRSAKGKGLAERRILYHHALRNALNPVITNIGIQIGYLLSGTVLVEAIFGWPGMGTYALDAVLNLDYPSVMGVALLVSVFFVLVNLAVDLLYAALDPRVSVA